MSDNYEENSDKLIIKNNKPSKITKDKVRQILIKNPNLIKDHIFDKFNYPIQEETNDKSNYNDTGDLNNFKKKIDIIDNLPNNILSVNFNQVNSYNYKILTNNVTNINKISNNPVSINIHEINSVNDRNDKIYKEDSLSKKTLEIIKYRKTPVKHKLENVKTEYESSDLISYFENFREYFKDRLLLENELDIIYHLVSKNLENIKENLLNFKNLIFHNLSPIGPMCDLDKIYFHCKLKNENQEIEKMSKDVNFWRLILGDGNCFYRAFIFSMIELWILQGNRNKFNKFICDIFHLLEENKNEMTKNKNIDRLEICGILFIILEYIKKNNLMQAYELFIKAFHKYKNFDIALIIYMRIVLFNYISKYKNYYYNTESKIEIGHLLPNEYIYDEDKFQFGEFFQNFLLKLHTEAEKIIIYLSPIIFGVNLDLFILEGLAKRDENKVKYIRQFFPCYSNGSNFNSCSINSNSLMTIRENELENFKMENENYLNYEKNLKERKINMFNNSINYDNNTISLLYRSAHYDKVYTYNFIKFFDNFDLKKSNFILINEDQKLFLDRMIDFFLYLLDIDE